MAHVTTATANNIMCGWGCADAEKRIGTWCDDAQAQLWVMRGIARCARDTDGLWAYIAYRMAFGENGSNPMEASSRLAGYLDHDTVEIDNNDYNFMEAVYAHMGRSRDDVYKFLRTIAVAWINGEDVVMAKLMSD